MLLAIDAGNTRIKWGLFDDSGELSNTGACLHAEFNTEALPAADNVIIASVANEKITNALISRFSSHSVTLAKPAASCGELVNSYRNIEQLGIDRWAAAVAAWQITQSPCLIVNAGTAITVDAIEVIDEQGQYAGGWIAPGLHTMQQSLAQNTAQLAIYSGNPSFDTKNAMLGFGLDTQTSIKSGTMAAAVGMIQLGQQRLSGALEKPVKVIFSGGDGKLIAQQCEQLGIQTHLDEHLVLKGLFAIHQSNNELT